MKQKEAQMAIPLFFSLFIFLLQNVITLKEIKQLQVCKIITFYLIILFLVHCILQANETDL